MEGTNFLDYAIDKDNMLDIVDGALFFNDATSFYFCWKFAINNGILVGKALVLNLYNSSALSSIIKEGTIVTILPDTGIYHLNNIFNKY